MCATHIVKIVGKSIGQIMFVIERVTKMVERRLNKPIAKVGKIPVFWLTEYRRSKWTCRGCWNEQKEGSLAMEITIAPVPAQGLFKSWMQNACQKEQLHFAQFQNVAKTIHEEINNDNTKIARKMHLCLDCGQKMLEEALQDIKLAKRGVPAFKFMKGV